MRLRACWRYVLDEIGGFGIFMQVAVVLPMVLCVDFHSGGPIGTRIFATLLFPWFSFMLSKDMQKRNRRIAARKALAEQLMASGRLTRDEARLLRAGDDG
jgi:hypothetical protein